MSEERLQVLGRSKIHLACQQGKIKALRFLHAQGVSINQRGINGDTPLHLSVSEGYERVVEWLLLNKANIHSINRVSCNSSSLSISLSFSLCLWLS
jgi:ankyrin repeat protein